MSVSPASRHIPGTWDCGLKSELGFVSFSALVAYDPWYPRIENHYHPKLFRAAQNFGSFSSEKHDLIHSFSSITCQVLRSKNIQCGRKDYVLVNCFVRLKCFINLSPEEKLEFLSEFSQGLFNTYNKLIAKEKALLEKHPKIKFNRNYGFPLTNARSLRLAVKTLCFEVADLPIPESQPYCANGLKKVIGHCKTVELEKSNSGSPVTQCHFPLSIVQSMIPESLHKLVLDGMCYNPGFRYISSCQTEHWCLHIHTPCSNDSDDEEEDEKNETENEKEHKKQPLSLQTACKLSILETCLKMRRARVTGKRRSPYYRASKLAV